MKTCLAELRLERGLSQRKLARELNMSSSSIALYETGKRTPSLDKAKKIATFFNTSIENIF